MLRKNNVLDIRREFAKLYRQKVFCENGTLEITGADFIADESSILGVPSMKYIKKEIDWYMSQERNIRGLEPNVPKIWKEVSSHLGEINSNYGWCIFSEENFCQFAEAIQALKNDKYSRQSVMIYTRPNMHEDAIRDGMRDFMCTNTVQMLIRNNRLEYHVNMRSNDVVFGYHNDYAWHAFIYDKAFDDLRSTYKNLNKSYMRWHAGSLHIYERHYGLVQEMIDSWK